MTHPKGTHVLQQVANVSQLTVLEDELLAALDHDGVTTLSIRVPWKAPGALDTIFARGLAMARAAGKKLSYRVMAGEHTPPEFMGESWPTRSGFVAPMPKMSNTTFLDAYRGMAGTLGDLGREAGDDVEVLHFCGAGERWAELSNSPEVRAEVSREEFVEFHVALMDLAREAVDCDVEFPMSGRGDLVWIIGQLADAAATRDIIVQANGLSDRVGEQWGSPSTVTEQEKDQAVFAKDVRRAVQMIQPQDYNWTQVYLNARVPELITAPAEYVEIYTPSFALARRELLFTEAAKFYAEQGEPTGTCEEDLALARLELADTRAELVEAQVALANAAGTIDQAHALAVQIANLTG